MSLIALSRRRRAKFLSCKLGLAALSTLNPYLIYRQIQGRKIHFALQRFPHLVAIYDSLEKVDDVFISKNDRPQTSIAGDLLLVLKDNSHFTIQATFYGGAPLLKIKASSSQSSTSFNSICVMPACPRYIRKLLM